MPWRVPLNQLFVGQPGTGKTTVAKLYGRILADMGLLSRGDVVVKTPADFLGDAIGKSEAQTQAILDAFIGKVLVIDEAYMLDPGNTGKEQDKYKSGVLDTIIANVHGTNDLANIQQKLADEYTLARQRQYNALLAQQNALREEEARKKRIQEKLQLIGKCIAWFV